MTRKQPITFRRNEVSYIMKRWQAGESCSVVGVGSIGKSNLIQHLADADVQHHYMGDAHTQFRAIVIDPLMLAPIQDRPESSEALRCWSGFELMMHRLFLAFYPFDVLEDDARRFYETYQALQDGGNPLYSLIGLRYFELGLSFFTRRNIQIVFMFDEFEELLRCMPARFFRSLRGIRDANKDLISYVAFSRAPMSALIRQMDISVQEIEPFIELFHDNVLYVGPYSDADAAQMIERIAARTGKSLNNSTTQFLQFATGNFAGLLRAACHALDNLDESTTEADYPALIRGLSVKPAVRQEAQAIWLGLSDSEHFVLRAVAGLTTYAINTETEQAVTLLVQKKLLRVNKTRQALEIEPPLLREFVLSTPGNEPA